MICLLLINDIIVFIRLMLSEDLGSMNLTHELYKHIYAECGMTLLSLEGDDLEFSIIHC